MRKYRFFNRPAKVSDVLQEDLQVDAAETWRQKAERLRWRRWHYLRNKRRMLGRVKHRRSPGTIS